MINLVLNNFKQNKKISLIFIISILLVYVFNLYYFSSNIFNEIILIKKVINNMYFNFILILYYLIISLNSILYENINNYSEFLYSKPVDLRMLIISKFICFTILSAVLFLLLFFSSFIFIKIYFSYNRVNNLIFYFIKIYFSLEILLIIGICISNYLKSSKQMIFLSTMYSLLNIFIVYNNGNLINNFKFIKYFFISNYIKNVNIIIYKVILLFLTLLLIYIYKNLKNINSNRN